MHQNIIGIFSGKGGVGKTTLTLNLSLALSQLKKNVIAVDADFKMSSLSLHLGLYQFPVTIADVLLSEKNILDAVYIHPTGIRIIPAPLYIKQIDTSKLKDILSMPIFLDGFILVDTPPGMENNVVDIMSACTSSIIITTPDLPSITGAIKIVQKLKEMKIPIIGAVINMNMHDAIKKEEIEEALETKVIGTIPFDMGFRKSLSLKIPLLQLNPYSSSSIEIKKIAATISNENFKPEKFLFFKKIMRGLRL